MKKRSLPILLITALLLALLPAGAMAAQQQYVTSSVPILIGYADLDYMADQILSEIPTEGKTAVEQIRAVYDWIIKNCRRYDWDGVYHFDENQVLSAVGDYYHQQLQTALDSGEAVIRAMYQDTLVYDELYGGYVMSYDSNDYIASFAYEMMMLRTGNCAHYSALLSLLLGHLGFDCRLIPGQFINSGGSMVEHKWNCVLVDGQYYWLDVRMDHAAYESSGRISYRYFMISDTDEWASRHNWDREYSDWLFANGEEIAGYNTVHTPIEPWSRCSPWAEEYMSRAYGEDLIPQRLCWTDLTESITRAEFAAVAVALYETLSGRAVPDYSEKTPFTDTDDPDVLRAYGLGIVNGMGDGLYAPDSTLTREQAVTMLGRVYELVELGRVGTGGELPQNGAPFSDDSAISAWSKNYVYFFVGAGVINGVGNGLFDPVGNMTREAALKVAVETVSRL